MSVIEECSEAIDNIEGFQAHDYTEWPSPERIARTILKTLAGKLDAKALQAALAPDGFLPERETREAIQCYLNQLINEEKE